MVDGRSDTQWVHTSHVLWMLAELERDPKKRSREFTPHDFNPRRPARRDDEEDTIDPKESWAMLKAFTVGE